MRLRAADRAFVFLTALALGSSAILVGLLWSLLPHVPRLLSGTGEPGDAVWALVLLLATIGITLGLASLGRQLWATLQLIRRLLRHTLPSPRAVRILERELGLAGRVDVVDDDRPFSFTYWFVRPRICLSTGLLDRLTREELRAVLSHERYHLLHRDPLRIVVSRYFAAGLYVVPVVDDLVAYYATLKEIEADQDAVRATGAVRPLASALYKLMPHAEEMDMGLLTPVGGLSVTEARIEQLIEQRPIAIPVRRGHIALSAAALIGALLLIAVQLPISVAPLDVQAAWASAGVILLAAVPGVWHQVRAFAQS